MVTNQPDEFNETLNRYYIFQDIRNWDLYQITELWLGYSDTMFWDIAENIMTRTAFSTIIKFKRLEEGTTWLIVPIAKPTSGGIQRTVAYKLSMKAIIAQNNLDDMHASLAQLQEGTLSYILLYLSDGTTDYMVYTLNRGTINLPGGSFQVEQSDISPFITINIEAYLSIDAFHDSTKKVVGKYV